MSLSGLTFAVLDDETAARTALASFLVRQGASVLPAESYAAWGKISSSGASLDLLILDLVLDDQLRDGGFKVLDDIVRRRIPLKVAVWSKFAGEIEYALQLSTYGIAAVLDKKDYKFKFTSTGIRALNPRTARILEAAARRGRFVCDDFNNNDVKLEEARVRGQITAFAEVLRATELTIEDPAVRKTVHKVVRYLNHMIDTRDGMRTYSWRLMGEYLKRFASDAAPASVVELIKIFLP